MSKPTSPQLKNSRQNSSRRRISYIESKLYLLNFYELVHLIYQTNLSIPNNVVNNNMKFILDTDKALPKSRQFFPLLKYETIGREIYDSLMG